ncbi:hypothetical protein [Mesorhizobium sp. B2-3-6]|uniref:hypothetical protein n=1 Tax=Mesorhizobium sp. B2-3-6 TaxID=2589957 RepID=UPI0011271387|nr:hypothetical protein [Mesorhizobium sp. B2-3-6]TPM12120.1 hypothetical protein FJ953_30285 [Mesorhizobium sp. B2-3-6]
MALNALLCFALLCFALLCFALLCFALLGFALLGLAWLGLAWLWLGLALAGGLCLVLRDLFLTLGVGFGYLRARDEGSQISGGPSAGYKNSPG